jgi:hypothetical protein
MASAVARAYSGGLGARPQLGPVCNLLSSWGGMAPLAPLHKSACVLSPTISGSIDAKPRDSRIRMTCFQGRFSSVAVRHVTNIPALTVYSDLQLQLRARFSEQLVLLDDRLARLRPYVGWLSRKCLDPSVFRLGHELPTIETANKSSC